MEGIDDGDRIAIVAMECRLPGADNVQEFWQKLVDGDDAIRDLSEQDLREAGIPPEEWRRADYVRRAGVLEGVDEFDSEYFGYSSREADAMDVQQRLMLESAVALCERANFDPSSSDRRVGVFAGSALSTYLFGVVNGSDLVSTLGEMVVRHGNDKDFLATRISYKLNLKGPSVNVQTACSTGLVAVHSAVQSLLLNECDAAIAGAVHVRVPQASGYKYQVGGVLSPDGTCRPFDADANGTLFANGLGLVMLRRLKDAIADGDQVWAVIGGSAVNNDGAAKMSFTAPSVAGQVDVLSDALAVSGADASDIRYIEAHGTGTALGDPVEIEAIKQAFGAEGPRCGIGSLKGSFGHLNIAAGIVGLIKAALVLKHNYVPPTRNLRETNPDLNLEGSRYFIVKGGEPLTEDGNGWVGVSAFGMGGTNSHVLLRAYDEVAEQATERDEVPVVLTLSARSADALDRQAARLVDHLAADPELSLAACALTLQRGRALHPHRAALAASTVKDAVARLRSGRFHRGAGAETTDLAFIFAGQGTQRRGMGARLAAANPKFAEHLEEALEALAGHAQFDVRAVLLSDSDVDITDTTVAQPVLFAVEHALAATLLAEGVRPNYVLGHSLGELVAATVAGVFELHDAAEVVVKRASLMGACAPGSMLAVDRLQPFADRVARGELSVAARNSSSQLVLSGSHAAIEEALDLASQAGVSAHKLATSHAFHSPLMTDAATSFFDFLQAFPLKSPEIPMISNITGGVLTEYEARNPRYWADHLLRTVDFSQSLATLADLGVAQFVEIGAGRAMTNLVKANYAPTGLSPDVVPVLSDAEYEDEAFADAVALGWANDPRVRLDAFMLAERMVALPTYAFERRSHWVAPSGGFAFEQPPSGSDPLARDEEAVDSTSIPAARTQDGLADASTTQERLPDSRAQAAMDEVREVVESIFSGFVGQVSGREDVGFFELGGNSLMAIQLINRVRETFEVDLAVRDFYENSSVIATAGVVTSLLLKESVDA